MENRICVLAMVKDSDTLNDAVMKFAATKFKKDQIPYLMIWNIGPDELTYEGNFHPDASAKMAVLNNDRDLITKKLYKCDYLSAIGDGMIVASQFVGIEAQDIIFYNFFSKPKQGTFTDHEQAIKTLKQRREQIKKSNES